MKVMQRAPQLTQGVLRQPYAAADAETSSFFFVGHAPMLTHREPGNAANDILFQTWVRAAYGASPSPRCPRPLLPLLQGRFYLAPLVSFSNSAMLVLLS
jgi:hypothetical protein